MCDKCEYWKDVARNSQEDEKYANMRFCPECGEPFVPSPDDSIRKVMETCHETYCDLCKYSYIDEKDVRKCRFAKKYPKDWEFYLFL